MAQATAKRMAEFLVADHPDESAFEVDFLDGPFTGLIIDALESLGCKVERVGSGTRLRVSQVAKKDDILTR